MKGQPSIIEYLILYTLMLLFWLSRLPVSDVSSKPQATPSDQRKDLALRRTGERADCLWDPENVLRLKLSEARVILHLMH